MRYALILLTSLISFASFAQKKSVKKLPPPPPRVTRLETFTPDIRNPFADEVSFSWKYSPDTLTTLTTADIFEKTYTFRNYGKNVRLSIAYPTSGFQYKKPNEGEISLAQSLTIHYKDYKNVTITGNTIKLVSDDGKEVVNLQVTKKGNQLVSLKQTGSDKVFVVTERYEGEPTIGL